MQLGMLVHVFRICWVDVPKPRILLLTDMVVVEDNCAGGHELILRVVCTDPRAKLVDKATVFREDNACHSCHFAINSAAKG